MSAIFNGNAGPGTGGNRRQTMSTNFKQLRETEAGMAQATDIMNRCVALVITFSGIGNHRKVDNKKVEVDADKDWIGVSKMLFDSPEKEEIDYLDGLTRGYVIDRCSLILKNGIYLVATDFTEEIQAELTKRDGERRKLVEKFVEAYDSLVAESRNRLRGLFNAKDYPSVQEIRDAYKMTWRIISWDTPANLKNVSKELYELECKKAAAAALQMRQDIEQILAASMAELVQHLVDRLTPEPGGKKKVFRDTAVTKLQDFLTTFNTRNVTNSAQLRAMADKAKQLIEGVDPADLRESQRTREVVRDGFAKIAKAVDGMIVNKPTRAISFDDN
jgi:predicted DNA-binding protein YlxM (UPF0122 family)